MTKVFITGDRAMNPLLALEAALLTLERVQEDHPGITPQDVLTGDLRGVEAAVRYLMPNTRVVPSQSRTDGKTDLDARHADAAADADACYVVHADPLDSRVYKSAVKFWGDESLNVVTF